MHIIGGIVRWSHGASVWRSVAQIMVGQLPIGRHLRTFDPVANRRHARPVRLQPAKCGVPYQSIGAHFEKYRPGAATYCRRPEHRV